MVEGWDAQVHLHHMSATSYLYAVDFIAIARDVQQPQLPLCLCGSEIADLNVVAK